MQIPLPVTHIYTERFKKVQKNPCNRMLKEKLEVVCSALCTQSRTYVSKPNHKVNVVSKTVKSGGTRGLCIALKLEPGPPAAASGTNCVREGMFPDIGAK